MGPERENRAKSRLAVRECRLPVNASLLGQRAVKTGGIRAGIHAGWTR